MGKNIMPGLKKLIHPPLSINRFFIKIYVGRIILINEQGNENAEQLFTIKTLS